MKKKICIVTGTRAEYGLFYPLLKRINKEKDIDLQIIATGMHLSPKFGLTHRIIEKDGFKINDKLKIILYGDTEVGISKTIGLAIMKFADSFKRLKPDMIILLGDRFETFSAAVAAFIARVPIVHLYGGELTEGAIDDAFRHSITKMSFLHFVSTKDYRKRVIQLGESPGRVFNVGALGIDNIVNLKLLPKEQLEKELKFTFGQRNMLVTFHPVTLENNTSEAQFRELISALKHFPDTKIIFTKANADTHGLIINRLIEKYVRDNSKRSTLFASLGQARYLSTMFYIDIVVGNSSSGIIEAPSLGKPSVNIGDRQKGRIKPESVIDCQADSKAIIRAINKALSAQFRKVCEIVNNPYGDGHAAGRIVKIIRRNLKQTRNLKKKFYDIKIKNV